MGFLSRLLSTHDERVDNIREWISGVFYNSRPSPTLYFDVGVDTGFPINEALHHLIYLPVINQREIIVCLDEKQQDTASV